ncbi:hypothetical protein MKK55_08780, partial [Methylobacterium sp. J-059]|nr:hypothetical protein [Methylobacterium sp. J-059]
MSHVHFPDFSQSVRPVLLDAERIALHADPILPASERRSEAWSGFQVAPSGQTPMRAEADGAKVLAEIGEMDVLHRSGPSGLVRRGRRGG